MRLGLVFFLASSFKAELILSFFRPRFSFLLLSPSSFFRLSVLPLSLSPRFTRRGTMKAGFLASSSSRRSKLSEDKPPAPLTQDGKVWSCRDRAGDSSKLLRSLARLSLLSLSLLPSCLSCLFPVPTLFSLEYLRACTTEPVSEEARAPFLPFRLF